MSLLDTLIEVSNTRRLYELERREEGSVIEGDFEGNVTGYWQKLDNTGAGIILYNRKEYVAKPIGFTSLPKGTEVELSHANGVYYAKF